MMKKTFRELLLYLVVGGIATVAEWLLFYLSETKIGIHYMPATIIAYVISTFVNWMAGRILIFKKSEKGIFREILGIYGASVIGLGLNLLIMWFLVDKIDVVDMIAKICATILVFAWNFGIRKLVIYKS